MIFNQRLYCSEWSRLNDPMEGAFVYSYSSTDGEDPKKLVDQIIEEKKRLRVCSMSLTFDRHLLWAHYASGFDGVAIEVELPDHSPEVKKIAYRGVFAGVSMDHVTNPGKTAETILSSKDREWEYDKEVRVVQQDEWYKLNKPVSRVIAGHRMQPALFEALHMVCWARGIELCRTGIGDEGIDADYVSPPIIDWPPKTLGI